MEGSVFPVCRVELEESRRTMEGVGGLKCISGSTTKSSAVLMVEQTNERRQEGARTLPTSFRLTSKSTRITIHIYASHR